MDVLTGEQAGGTRGRQDDVDVADLAEVVAEVELERRVSGLVEQGDHSAADEPARPDDGDPGAGVEERRSDPGDAVGRRAGRLGRVDAEGVDVLGRGDRVQQVDQASLGRGLDDDPGDPRVAVRLVDDLRQLGSGGLVGEHHEVRLRPERRRNVHLLVSGETISRRVAWAAIRSR